MCYPDKSQGTSKNKKFSNRFPVVKYMSLRKLFKKIIIKVFNKYFRFFILTFSINFYIHLLCWKLQKIER